MQKDLVTHGYRKTDIVKLIPFLMCYSCHMCQPQGPILSEHH